MKGGEQTSLSEAGSPSHPERERRFWMQSAFSPAAPGLTHEGAPVDRAALRRGSWPRPAPETFDVYTLGRSFSRESSGCEQGRRWTGRSCPCKNGDISIRA